MTQKNRETMQKAIGIIDGLSFVTSQSVADALEAVIEMLEEVLKKEARLIDELNPERNEQ